MSSRSCPDWPQLMEVAPELQFKHYTLREAQLPADALVNCGECDFDVVEICCDLDSHVFNAEHTDPIVTEALRATPLVRSARVAESHARLRRRLIARPGHARSRSRAPEIVASIIQWSDRQRCRVSGP